ncbi:hypothetical protein H5410_005966 [Solanum commersonii]|uniref:Uncharacterized protein n=1 Tax=Solanum commersonii TaxID=4109 RepID=A0A9J6A8X4_SOLCO|nr:hypothetical protein H5410_005966 [Solanum commersonii]
MMVEIDLMKPLIIEIQVTVKISEGQTEAFNQKIEYENILESLLQHKEMHMDMNCQEDLEALTIEIEEGWKHEMMDLTIENNDLNENKDREQENKQNTLFVNKSTRWDKDRQSKTNERQNDNSERNHHNLRVRKARKEVQSYLENIEKKIQSNKEDVNINELNLLKDLPAKKQRFKGKVHIPKRVNLEGVVQGSRSEAEQTWPQLTLAKMDHPLNLNDQKADFGERDVRNLAQTLDPDPPDSSNKITTFQVNN